MSHLSINDTQTSIGEERLVVTNPMPLLPAPADSGRVGWSYELRTLADRVAHLEERVMFLETAVDMLLGRTFWSMFKDWVRSFWE